MMKGENQGRCGMYPGFSAQLNVKGGDEGATLREVGWLKGFFPS
ncbi:hypothetical protein [uncultured Mitsuokella sp.]|nr:hypothetical protein [uncultured Mitsuokella sp.]